MERIIEELIKKIKSETGAEVEVINLGKIENKKNEKTKQVKEEFEISITNNSVMINGSSENLLMAIGLFANLLNKKCDIPKTLILDAVETGFKTSLKI